MMTKIQPTHIGIAILSSFLMSLNIVLIKMGTQHFPPLLFSALRFAATVPFVLFLPHPPTSPKLLFKISLCWGVIYLGGLNLALSMSIPAGTATIITQLSTFIGFFLSWKLFNDPPSIDKIWGALMGFAGVALVCMANINQGRIWGMLILLGCAISFALGAVYVKQAQTSSLSLNVWITAYSILPVLLASLIFGEPWLVPLQSANLTHWSVALMAGWCSTLFGGVCWLFIVSKYSLNVAMPFRLLIPVFGVVLGHIALGETYPFITWIGGGVVIAGLSFPYVSSALRKTTLFEKQV